MMWLTQRLGCSLQEQIAALLHDISHTAFSHVIDHVFNGPNGESYHELKKEEYLEKSDIPKVLGNYGFDWRDFISEDNYPILEQPAPALCADRLDYFFRDGIATGLFQAKEVNKVLMHLSVRDKLICVNKIEEARWLAYNYMKADELIWSELKALGLYELMAQLTQTGFLKSIITEADVWLTDQQLWNKVSSSPDPELQFQILQITKVPDFVLADKYPWRILTPKIRTINPALWMDGKKVLLTDLDTDFRSDLTAYNQMKQRILPLQLVR
ncbi:HD domain-containing protein [Dyadobacter frigoris]|uniref:HD domain-containing protein n=1 Tax=Dyadobacter frigoris TaxID=2576211 RepID=A0A4U6CMQ5_9BACT|nr:HD domain-containing protein [Dyadobacter frigoris]